MKKALMLLTITLIVVCTLCPSSYVRVAAENDDKTKLHKVKNPIPDQYIVLFKTGVRGKDVDKFATKLAKDNNGRILYVYKFIKGFGVEMTENDAIKLSNDKDVEFVEENGPVRTTQSSCPNSSATLPGHYGVDRLDQRYVPRDGNYCPTRTGRGVNVFVIDTGIWPTHDDFKNPDGTSRAAVFYDAFGGDGLDCNNHGTFVASTVGGNLYGVAKEANIYGVKVFRGCNGGASGSDLLAIAAGVDAVSASGLPQKVINMSVEASGFYADSIDAAVRRAINIYGIPSLLPQVIAV